MTDIDEAQRVRGQRSNNTPQHGREQRESWDERERERDRDRERARARERDNVSDGDVRVFKQREVKNEEKGMNRETEREEREKDGWRKRI